MLYLANLTLKQVVEVIVGVLVVISAFVEWNKKLPYHPISSFISWLGKNLMKSTLDEINARFCELEQSHNTKSAELETQQKANNEAIIELSKKVDKKFNEQQRQADEKEAKRLRASIISFSDSCRIHDKHTKTHFENIFRDYDDYMAYCEKHNLANHYIEGEYAYIKDVYQECLSENKFL